MAINLTPYQGLKRGSVIEGKVYLTVAINLTPYQGLKLVHEIHDSRCRH